MASEVRIGSAVLDLRADSTRFEAGTRRARRQTRALEQAQRRLRNQLRRTSAAAQGYVRSIASIRGAIVTLAGSGGIGLFIANTARAGSELQNFADQVGFSVESLQALQRAGGDWNIEATAINDGLTRFSRAVGEAVQGTTTYLDIFNDLGVAIRNADGSLRDTEVVFEEFTRALQGLGSQAERNSYIMQTFGRSGARLGLLFQSVASQGIDAFVASQRRAGILTQAQVDSLQSLNRSFNSLGDVLTYHRRQLVANVAGPWEDIIDLIGQRAPQAFNVLESAIRTIVIPVLNYTVTNTNAAAASLAAFILTFSSFGAALRTGLGAGFAQLFRNLRRMGDLYLWVAVQTSGFQEVLANAIIRMKVFASSARLAGAAINTMTLSVTALGVAVQLVGGALLAVRAVLLFIATRLIIPVVKLAAAFTIISTAIQAFTDFDNTITNLRAFGDALVNVFLEAGRFVADFFVQTVWPTMLDGLASQVQQLLRSAQSILTPDNPGRLPPRVGGAARAQTERALENLPFQNAIDAIGRFRQGLKASATEASNLGEALSEAVEAWRNLVFGVNVGEQGQQLVELRRRRMLAFQFAQNEARIRERFEREASERESRLRRTPEQVAANRRRLLGFLFAQNEGALRAQTGVSRDQAILNTEIARRAAAGAGSARFREIVKQAEEAQDRLNMRLQRNQELLGSMQSGFERFFESLLDGTAKASDAFKALAADIVRAVTRALIIQPIASAITGGISSFFNLPTPTAAQSGGSVFPGRPVLLGESGPEYFFPTEAGRIVPNRDIGGSPVFNFNYNIESTDGPGVAAALATARPIFQQDAIDAVAAASQRTRGLNRG